MGYYIRSALVSVNQAEVRLSIRRIPPNGEHVLTQSQIESYNRDGFIGVDGVLNASEIEDLVRITGEFIEKSRSVTEHNDVFDLEPGHTPDAPRLRRLKDPAKQHPVYDAMLRHEGILSIVAQLVGPDIRCNGQKLNIKSGEFGSPVEWHQDWAFYPHTNDDLLAVGIAIDGMTLKNGCLLAVPGSHRGPVLNHHQDGFFAGGVTDPDFDASDAVPIQVGPGGISIHHVRALHGSAPNTSADPRRLLLYQYCAVDAWPLSGVSDLPAFNSLILRGEPTLEPRVTDVPVRIPLPMPENTGSIYEIQTTLKNRMYAGKQ